MVFQQRIEHGASGRHHELGAREPRADASSVAVEGRWRARRLDRPEPGADGRVRHQHHGRAERQRSVRVPVHVDDVGRMTAFERQQPLACPPDIVAGLRVERSVHPLEAIVALLEGERGNLARRRPLRGCRARAHRGEHGAHPTHGQSPREREGVRPDPAHGVHRQKNGLHAAAGGFTHAAPDRRAPGVGSPGCR